MPQLHYIYLVHEIQFQNPHQDIYKIGKTTRKHYSRINQYAKGVKELLVMECDDCHKCEKQLIEIFKKKFKQRKDVAGEESFEGDKYEMMDIIFSYVVHKLKNSSNIELKKILDTEKSILPYNELSVRKMWPMYDDDPTDQKYNEFQSKYEILLNKPFVINGKFLITDSKTLTKLDFGIEAIYIRNNYIKISCEDGTYYCQTFKEFKELIEQEIYDLIWPVFQITHECSINTFRYEYKSFTYMQEKYKNYKCWYSDTPFQYYLDNIELIIDNDLCQSFRLAKSEMLVNVFREVELDILSIYKSIIPLD